MQRPPRPIITDEAHGDRAFGALLRQGVSCGLHNATGQRGVWGRQDPLSIWISDDEMASWSIREDVLHGGMLAYPNGMVLDGRLVFAYDRDRRQAWFVEVEIS